MSKITQIKDKIDQLLSSLNSNTKNYKLYDFKRPFIISKENIRDLSNGFILFSRKTSERLSILLNKKINVYTAFLDQISFDECKKDCATYDYTLLMRMHNSDFFIKTQSSFICDLNYNNINNFNKKIAKLITECLNLTFNKRFNIKNNQCRLKSCPDKINADAIIKPYEMCFVMGFEIVYGEKSCNMNIYMPFNLIKWICSKYNNLKEEEKFPINCSKLEETKVPVEVIVGKTEMTAKDVKGIGEGSIIILDSITGKPFNIRINGMDAAKGEVFVKDEKFNIKVTDIKS